MTNDSYAQDEGVLRQEFSEFPVTAPAVTSEDETGHADDGEDSWRLQDVLESKVS